ncbi:U3 small nucleolar ribonucleoprotein protein MPP10 [Wyeomyia smithii]|uniref:U3 small nucleolar ribonucleoprotein protein MPP10 n=1 Tax=Wyeomyia smithii TaxID=174621 RepID=UPI002467BB89|nr:U3 small nucleolar ribonucleoprotein protein MPP10 [Wyeomyia smithii]
MTKMVSKVKANKKGLKGLLKKFHEQTKNPECFLSAQPKHTENIKELLKSLYDYGQKLNDEETPLKPYLEELVVDEMDDEQIWQQLELKNEQLLSEDLSKTSQVLSFSSKRIKLAFKKNDKDSQRSEEKNNENDTEDLEKETANIQRTSKKKLSTTKEKRIVKRSVVDDEFFRLEDMARFLDEEDKRETRRQAGKPEQNPLIEIDYFDEHAGEDDNDNEEGIKYSDFFDDNDENDSDEHSGEGENNEDEPSSSENDNTKSQPDSEDSADEVERNRRLRYELYAHSGEFIEKKERKRDPSPQIENSDSESESKRNNLEDNQPKSSFELRQEKLQQRIQKMEDQMLQEKPWQLKGEISADTRPQNSLLEELLEFESTTRPAPAITEETTMRLEDIIKQRIRNKAFDDVERKVRPPENPREYRKQLVLDAEKSKQSLAEIYEQDYLKQLEKANPNSDLVEEEEPKEHKQIRSMMKTLIAQLDALSNFHYTPRPAVPELKIITNTPAINMEEVAPVATSDAALLAPEEVHNRPKGDVMSKDERSKADKNRERRLKKRFQRDKFAKQAEKERRLLEKGAPIKAKATQEKLLKKVTKAKNVVALKETKGVSKSSAAFFSQLQDAVSTQVKRKLNPDLNQSKKTVSTLQATHIKL